MLNESEGNCYDALNMFTDREEIISLFQQALHSAQRSRFHLLAIKGSSGTGKTFLIDYLARKICPSVNWRSGQLSFAQSKPDFRYILEGIASALKGCVSYDRFEQYRAKRDECYRHFDEYKGISVSSIQLTMEANNQSSISASPQIVQINAQLRDREMHLFSELNNALIGLSESCTHPLCLFIDDYERLPGTDPELEGWLWEKTILKLVKASPQPLLVLVCGWETPNNPAIKPFFFHSAKDLEEFDLKQVRSYLAKEEVITSTIEPSLPEEEALITTFYDLTKGHPLFLSLVVTYFKHLDSNERTAQNLRISKPLLDEQARVAFLEDHLLKRLPEPYRPLLEWGPILRRFDQAALKALLSAGDESKATVLNKLNDSIYDRFLRYPFFNEKNITISDSLPPQHTFHNLLRQLCLVALCHHPQTKELLHRKMAVYYREQLNVEQKRIKNNKAFFSGTRHTKGIFGKITQHLKERNTTINKPPFSLLVKNTEGLAEVSEKAFLAEIEYLYHAMQVEEFQIEALGLWATLIRQAIDQWERKSAEMLLAVVQQLSEEGESLFRKTSSSYGHYLGWYSRFLEQERRWKDALVALNDAKLIFESCNDVSEVAGTLHNIGAIYYHQGKMEDALEYFEQALNYKEQINKNVVAMCLNDIGGVFYARGDLKQALQFCEQSSDLYESTGDTFQYAVSLNITGSIYQDLGSLQKASQCHKRALNYFRNAAHPLHYGISLSNLGEISKEQGRIEESIKYHTQGLASFERLGDPSYIAFSLEKLGLAYHEQGFWDQALNKHERALALRKCLGNDEGLASSFNNIGRVYRQVGKLEDAFHFYQQALDIDEKNNNVVGTATILNNLGLLYAQRGQFQQALDAYNRALVIRKHIGNPTSIATVLNNLGLLYQQQRQLQQALDTCNRALIYDKKVGNPANIGASFNNIGSIYHDLGERRRALDFYKRALPLLERVGNPYNTASLLSNIGCIYAETGQIDNALRYFEQSLSIYKRIKCKSEIKTIKSLIDRIRQ